MITIDGRLYSESALLRIQRKNAGFEVELADGRCIFTYDEPCKREVVPASGLEVWQPVDLGDGRVVWDIEPMAALVVEHYIVSGTVVHAGVLPAGGWSDDLAQCVLVDRQRRLARPMHDATACWTDDLAAALSAALGRPVEVDDVPKLARAA